MVATGVVVPPGPPSPATSSSSGPPSGYVLAGQMNLGGAIRVPAFNSANLSEFYTCVKWCNEIFSLYLVPAVGMGEKISRKKGILGIIC